MVIQRIPTGVASGIGEPTAVDLDKLGLVEKFIAEIEGPPNNCDVTRWGKFTDSRDIKKEMFQRFEVQFENWLNS